MQELLPFNGDPIDILMYGISAIIVIHNSDKHQRTGDMWAKTIVVDTNDPEQYSNYGAGSKNKQNNSIKHYSA